MKTDTGVKVLVIEDEPASLKLAHLVLAAEGYQVVDAQAAEEALDVIKKNRPQVILLDLGLPGMNGLELASRLKLDPTTRSIPIVAVTAYPDRWSQREAVEAGCDAYIVKPIDTRRLPAKVSEVAGRRA